MRIVALWSFRDGLSVMEKRYPVALREIRDAIKSVDTERHIATRVNESRPGNGVLRPQKVLRNAFREALDANGWQRVRVKQHYSTEYYVNGYQPPVGIRSSHRVMDFVKDQVGIEIQLTRCWSMVCSVAAKMTIFHRLGYIDMGVEIIPVKELASELSLGGSFFEQHVWDLQSRGTSSIDIPMLVIGIDRSPD